MSNKTNSVTYDVIAVGDVLVDNLYWVNAIPASGCDEMIIKSSRQSGGSAANTAVLLNTLGVNCCFCGKIGSDEIGREISKGLLAIGDDLRCLQKSSGKTGYTLTLIEPNGERTMLSYRDSSAEPLQMTDELIETVKEAKILFLSGYLLSTPLQADFVFNLSRIARDNNTIIMQDTSPIIGSIDRYIIKEMLSLTDVLMPNLQELLEISCTENVEDGIRLLLDKVPAIVIKMGNAGSRLVARNDSKLFVEAKQSTVIDCFVPAVPIKSTNTTGAGDSFNAGFIAAFLKGGEPKDWLTSGNYVASQVITNKMKRSLFIE